jgi:cell wall-associated NlpC family hydrolase
MSTTLDPRRHAYREDLAAETLRDRVSAPRYTAGQTRQIAHSATPLRGRPDPRASWTSEVLFGEQVTLYEEKDGWAWAQTARDGYVGYLRAAALSPQVQTPTHRVRALGTLLYPAADVKAPPWLPLSMNSLLPVAEVGPSFSRLTDGSFVPTRHIAELAWQAQDFVAVAEQFAGTPYLWGGRSRLGIDCSGLVQVALQMSGVDCPRDSDMQQAELGNPVPLDEDLSGMHRGDLVFWPGHVGIMTDTFLLLHANAHHMKTVVEPLKTVVGRNARAGDKVIAVKRLAPSP